MGFDETLIENIKDFQRKHDLEVDGLVGPKTFRRIFTELEAQEEMNSHIRCNREDISINWDNVVGLASDDALVLPPSCFQKAVNFARKPKLIVTHWDAALSATSCYKILKRRGISSHFAIDNDGTIYQMVDTNDVAWHAKGSNDRSIGIDISNAYYPKYQRVYRKRGFGNRPLLKSSVHGRPTGLHLGYYDVQLKAYQALVQSLAQHYGIPLECPCDDEGNLYEGVYTPAVKGEFEGVVCHYHLNSKKLDCAGLPLKRLLDEVKAI
jgi:hypothetical protein|tara:strand:+ start:1692 stop:2489 length:798 start_codon:yes stop_codon:yes gene_type:complete